LLLLPILVWQQRQPTLLVVPTLFIFKEIIIMRYLPLSMFVAASLASGPAIAQDAPPLPENNVNTIIV